MTWMKSVRSEQNSGFLTPIENYQNEGTNLFKGTDLFSEVHKANVGNETITLWYYGFEFCFDM